MRISISHVFVTEEAGDMHRGGRLSLGPVSATGAGGDAQRAEQRDSQNIELFFWLLSLGAGGQGRCH